VLPWRIAGWSNLEGRAGLGGREIYSSRRGARELSSVPLSYCFSVFGERVSDQRSLSVLGCTERPTGPWAGRKLSQSALAGGKLILIEILVKDQNHRGGLACCRAALFFCVRNNPSIIALVLPPHRAYSFDRAKYASSDATSISRLPRERKSPLAPLPTTHTLLICPSLSSG